MKVYLGGTVNGSSWRDYVISKLRIEYFNPVVKDWDEEAHKRELEARKHSNFCLYVITPKMTGFYSLAEVTDDAIKRPDRTIYCYLREDGEDEFDEVAINSLESIGRRVERNGAVWLHSLDEVITYLNTAKKQADEFLDEKDGFLDAFISYGRKNSKAFTEDLTQYLTNKGLTTWYDDGLVPLEIKHLEKVNALIERSHNFIYVISPHSVQSEYCQRELEYAKKLKKRIIPIIHKQPVGYWENIPFDIRHGKILFYTKAATKESLFADVMNWCMQHRTYIEKHTELLCKALKWHENRQPSQLLIGSERKSAIKWLNMTFSNAKPPCRPSEFHKAFIEASEAISISKRFLFFLNKLTGPVTGNKHFDRVIGFFSLANPISLLPQLYTILDTQNVQGISTLTFLIFVCLNLAFALMAIKQKNLGIFLSMFLSMLMNLAIVVLTYIWSN